MIASMRKSMSETMIMYVEGGHSAWSAVVLVDGHTLPLGGVVTLIGGITFYLYPFYLVEPRYYFEMSQHKPELGLKTHLRYFWLVMNHITYLVNWLTRSTLTFSVTKFFTVGRFSCGQKCLNYYLLLQSCIRI